MLIGEFITDGFDRIITLIFFIMRIWGFEVNIVFEMSINKSSEWLVEPILFLVGCHNINLIIWPFILLKRTFYFL